MTRLDRIDSFVVGCLACCFLSIGLLGCKKSSPTPANGTASPADSATSEAQRLEEALQLLNTGQHRAAMRLIQGVLIASPDHAEALAVAIEIHSQLGELTEAADLAERIAELQPENASFILLKAFDWRLRSGDHRKAEADLRQAIRLQPDAVNLRRTMAQLLNAQGRRYEASEHLRALVRLDANSPEELLGLIDISGPFSLVSFAEVVDPSEVTLFRIADARNAFLDTITPDPDKAIRILNRVRERFPDAPAAAALLGRILADTSDMEGLKEWSKRLPAGIDEHPEYWFAIGSWLAESDRHEEAVRAFGEAIRRDPTDRYSLRLMIASLERLNQMKLALALRPRLATLDDIFRKALNADAEQSKQIAKQLDELVRPWEATGWLKLAAMKDGLAPPAELAQRRASITNWQKDATEDRVRDARLNTVLGFKVSSWPLPKIESVIEAAPRLAAEAVATEMRLDDIAKSVGIDTTFVSGLPPPSEPYFLYQMNGGGLAAFDYDLDGLCDVYIVQSGGKPLQAKSTPNQLFRQLPGGTFIEVSDSSAANDRGFGQGVCAGDINQDGFLDLVVANIGKNAIYLNQGDGTFRSSPESITENPSDWTSSVALADIDGDHLPDYVAANYIDDPSIYVHMCQGGWLSEGRMDCVPQQHQAANDRVLRNSGDGTFEPFDGVEGINEKPNFGFGILIANIDRKNGNDIFITNDGDLNHYWGSQPKKGQTKDSPGSYSMLESAGVLGCSIGANGQSQACMGLGAGDFDRNGYLDFHVTNFYNESSNLYLQNESGFFIDDALKYGLKPLTYKVVGFGTQAVDFDNDGWQDLAVLNGHVHDDRKVDIPFQMESQLFRGGGGRFTQQKSEQLGDYWPKKRLGRTLAKLDWNRDGRVDLLANHLDSPIALIENRTAGGNWLQLELAGVTSERDAIGAEVTVKAGQQEWTRWQLGGDGYMCSNEPILHVGVGPATTADHIEVRWPSGQTQTFDGLETNRRYLIVEGQDEAFAR